MHQAEPYHAKPFGINPLVRRHGPDLAHQSARNEMLVPQTVQAVATLELDKSDRNLNMKNRLLFSASLVVAMATTATAAPYQFTTPVPPGIAIPNKVDTRLGPL
jgi:hypothetical protein